MNFRTKALAFQPRLGRMAGILLIALLLAASPLPARAEEPIATASADTALVMTVLAYVNDQQLENGQTGVVSEGDDIQVDVVMEVTFAGTNASGFAYGDSASYAYVFVRKYGESKFYVFGDDGQIVASDHGWASTVQDEQETMIGAPAAVTLSLEEATLEVNLTASLGPLPAGTTLHMESMSTALAEAWAEAVATCEDPTNSVDAIDYDFIVNYQWDLEWWIQILRRMRADGGGDIAMVNLLVELPPVLYKNHEFYLEDYVILGSAGGNLPTQLSLDSPQLLRLGDNKVGEIDFSKPWVTVSYSPGDMVLLVWRGPDGQKYIHAIVEPLIGGLPEGSVYNDLRYQKIGFFPGYNVFPAEYLRYAGVIAAEERTSADWKMAHGVIPEIPPGYRVEGDPAGGWRIIQTEP